MCQLDVLHVFGLAMESGATYTYRVEHFLLYCVLEIDIFSLCLALRNPLGSSIWCLNTARLDWILLVGFWEGSMRPVESLESSRKSGKVWGFRRLLDNAGDLVLVFPQSEQSIEVDMSLFIYTAKPVLLQCTTAVVAEFVS